MPIALPNTSYPGRACVMSRIKFGSEAGLALAADVAAELGEHVHQILVAAVDVLGVIYHRLAFGRQRGQRKGSPRTDVETRDRCPVEWGGAVDGGGLRVHV